MTQSVKPIHATMPIKSWHDTAFSLTFVQHSVKPALLHGSKKVLYVIPAKAGIQKKRLK
ncbi:hypothetical protein [Rickettsia endosymbiont of Polydrusus tereticollis]|uniref:hypothetical protein n=1 Tax=Rickettsia endosymbiont of Polydrusus tereticollis TaxID=3066251 RepID=UPI00313352A7